VIRGSTQENIAAAREQQKSAYRQQPVRIYCPLNGLRMGMQILIFYGAAQDRWSVSTPKMRYSAPPPSMQLVALRVGEHHQPLRRGVTERRVNAE
jgi:hypothetical protein